MTRRNRMAVSVLELEGRRHDANGKLQRYLHGYYAPNQQRANAMSSPSRPSTTSPWPTCPRQISYQ